MFQDGVFYVPDLTDFSDFKKTYKKINDLIKEDNGNKVDALIVINNCE